MKHKKPANVSFDVLDTSVSVTLTVNELRMIINCFNALEYQCQLDDEPYLTGEALQMVERLKKTYEMALNGTEGFIGVKTG